MYRFKSAKIYFCFAVLLLVVKPFLGFSMFSRSHPPASQNIFVKVFNKRLLEYSEDSRFNVIAVQKKLADPAVGQLIFRFSFLLSILFPLLFNICTGITNGFLRRMQLTLYSGRPTWLLNNTVII